MAHRPVEVRLSPLPVLALALVAGTVVFLAARLLLAGFAGYQAQAFLDDWRARGEVPTPRAAQVGEQAAQRALAWFPGQDGQHWQRLGEVHEWPGYRAPLGDPAAAAGRREALAAYRRATAARPDWPFTWTRLAHVKLQLRELDGELAQAIAMALATGPWRIDVMRDLTEIGFIAWPSLGPDTRGQVLTAAERAVAHSRQGAQFVGRVLEHTGMSGVFCAHLRRSGGQDRGLCPAAQADGA